MATTRKKNDDRDTHERAAGGLDFDDPIRERAASLGAAMAEGGPQALFEEIENLLPEEWQEHLRSFPLAAVRVGVGIGVFLGMKKGGDVIAAGSSLISAAAMPNIPQA